MIIPAQEEGSVKPLFAAPKRHEPARWWAYSLGAHIGVGSDMVVQVHGSARSGSRWQGTLGLNGQSLGHSKSLHISEIFLIGNFLRIIPYTK